MLQSTISLCSRIIAMVMVIKIQVHTNSSQIKNSIVNNHLRRLSSIILKLQVSNRTKLLKLNIMLIKHRKAGKASLTKPHKTNTLCKLLSTSSSNLTRLTSFNKHLSPTMDHKLIVSTLLSNIHRHQSLTMAVPNLIKKASKLLIMVVTTTLGKSETKLTRETVTDIISLRGISTEERSSTNSTIEWIKLRNMSK